MRDHEMCEICNDIIDFGYMNQCKKCEKWFCYICSDNDIDDDDYIYDYICDYCRKNNF